MIHRKIAYKLRKYLSLLLIFSYYIIKMVILQVSNFLPQRKNGNSDTEFPFFVSLFVHNLEDSDKTISLFFNQK